MGHGGHLKIKVMVDISKPHFWSWWTSRRFRSRWTFQLRFRYWWTSQACILGHGGHLSNRSWLPSYSLLSSDYEILYLRLLHLCACALVRLCTGALVRLCACALVRLLNLLDASCSFLNRQYKLTLSQGNTIYLKEDGITKAY